MHSKQNFESIRATSLASKNAEIAAKRALRENAAGVKGKSAAPGSVRVQRGDFYENNVGKFISIEANADGVTYTGTNGNIYNGPTLTAECYDAAGNKLGGGLLDDYTDTDVTPDYYQYHYGVFRYGNKGDNTPQVGLGQGVLQQRRRRHAGRQGMGHEGPAGPRPELQERLREPLLRLAGRDPEDQGLATEFPNITTLTELPNKTHGYQRPAATMLGYVNTNTNAPNATTPYVRIDTNDLPVAGSRAVNRAEPSTVVVTSKAMGHLGGNSLDGPDRPARGGRDNQALDVTADRQRDPRVPGDQRPPARSPAPPTTSSRRSTPHPDASRVVRATKYRSPRPPAPASWRRASRRR